MICGVYWHSMYRVIAAFIKLSIGVSCTQISKRFFLLLHVWCGVG